MAYSGLSPPHPWILLGGSPPPFPLHGASSDLLLPCLSHSVFSGGSVAASARCSHLSPKAQALTVSLCRLTCCPSYTPTLALFPVTPDGAQTPPSGSPSPASTLQSPGGDQSPPLSPECLQPCYLPLPSPASQPSTPQLTPPHPTSKLREGIESAKGLALNPSVGVAQLCGLRQVTFLFCACFWSSWLCPGCCFPGL